MMLSRAVVAGASLALAASIAVPTAARGADSGPGAGWGSSANGQLGYGGTKDQLKPIAVFARGALDGAALTAISAGTSHTCAIDDLGRGYCWGKGSYGRLGTGSVQSRLTAEPVRGIPAGRRLVSISAGAYHSCAVDDQGLGYCWGWGAAGRLGTGDNVTTSTARAVDTSGALAGKVLRQISAGYDSTCAVDTEGLGYCWGEGASGQLGTDTINNRFSPAAVWTAGVLAGRRLLAVSVGRSHACARDDAGRGFCWGDGLAGQLGDGSNTSSKVPVAVSVSGALSGRIVTTISAGAGFTCATTSDKNGFCWGDGASGRLGNGGTAGSAVPSPVTGGHRFTSVAAGATHACALNDSGAGFCWGNGADGRLGDNKRSGSAVPVPVYADGVLSGRALFAITAGGASTMALSAGPPLPTPPEAPRSVTVTAGDRSATVKWKPGFDGLLPLQNYTVTSVPAGSRCVTKQTSCTLKRLTNGKTYTFTIVARNSLGASPRAVSPAVVPGKAAARPTMTIKKVRVKKHGKVVVRWRATSASTVKLRVSKTGKPKKFGPWQVVRKSPARLVLAPKHKYRIKMRAFGSGGRSPVAKAAFRTKK